jgi:hypothetical protein
MKMKFTIDQPMVNLVANYLTTNPDMRCQQYVLSTSEVDNDEEIAIIILDQQFARLVAYTDFDIPKLLQNGTFTQILSSGLVDVARHLIDYCINANTTDANGQHLVEYLIQYGTVDLVKYYLGKYDCVAVSMCDIILEEMPELFNILLISRKIFHVMLR